MTRRSTASVACPTNHSKRCNPTLRQRVACLGRAPVSFSKQLINHSDAIELGLCHYHLTKVPA